MKQAKKLESVKNEMYALKTSKTVIGGMQMNATYEKNSHGKVIKVTNDGM